MSDIPNSARTRVSGILLVVISAMVFSTAGIFTRGVETDAWGVIFWRGLAAAGFTFLWMVLRGRLRAELRAYGRPAALVTLLMATGTAAFIPAFKLSSVANVALIYATAPFLAAGLSLVFLREAPTRRIMLASLGALAGVAVIVSGSVGAVRFAGDALALVMTLMMAGTMIVYRARPDTTAALPAALSSVALLPVSGILGDPMATAPAELPVLILFGLVFAVASVTLSEGARRLPPPDTALLSAIEVPLAPLLAWLVLAETISVRTFCGGVLILVAVAWSQKRPK